ncbi:MAG: DUF2066 domain-containing protein [Spiribacter sp.]|nr:DUF2066 domain-containing protein [Spiribacter sp.]MDR9489124.1 DUF2066 domain-containing protein [Spiribacter sp.]
MARFIAMHGINRVGLTALMIGLVLGLMAVSKASTPGAVEVPVADESEAAREPAVEQAVGEMLVQLTGDPSVLDALVAEQISNDAQQYLEGFSYRQAPALMLSARFNTTRLRERLVRAGIKVWPEQPVTVLVWLAIEQEGERRLADAKQDADVLQRLRTQAEQLGLRLMFPLMDLEDLAAVSPAEVAAGFAEPIREASTRYDPDRILSVRLSESGAARWTLISDEAVMTRWQTGPGGLDDTLDSAVERLVARLTREFAYLPDLFASRRLNIAVSGIDSLRIHDRVVARLEALAGVERATALEVDADQVRFALAINTPEARVLKAIARDSRLLADGEQYRWQ